jgi:ATP-dependent helicase/nuclease subunit A
MSREKLVDEEARIRAVEDLDTSLCVEAGAGTGKTTLLVDRYLEIVTSGRARCGQVVAITFTEKAAVEMKFRVRMEIENRLKQGILDDERRARLEEALYELERAPISTIHSFASVLLREHPLEAGVDPRFDHLDEVHDPQFIEECWMDFLASVPPERALVVQRFLTLGGTLGLLRQMADTLYYHRGERHVDSFSSGDRPCGDVPLDSVSEFAALVSEISSELSRLVRDHCTNHEDLGCKEVERFLRELGELGGVHDSEDVLLGLGLPAGNKGNKKNWSPKEACGEMKDLVERLRAGMFGFKSALVDRLRDELVGWLEGFLELIESRKAAKGLLGFDDLLIRARGLLRNTDALEDLRERYRFILVDEFQDTDPLQTEIVLLLSGAAESDDQGKLFVVGDPKQSIYRFRNADVEIYEEVKQRFAGSGSHLNISQNFRSVPSIVEWVNETFGSIIVQPDEGKYQPRYEPIHAMRRGAERAVIALDLELESESTKAGEVRRREGTAIARLIRYLVEGNRTVIDPVTKKEGRIAYRHIAVVYPGTTGIDYYEEPMRRAAVPYIIEGGKLYYTRQEVRDLASAIKAIEDPWDTIALVAALRSPLFGFSDEEIFLFNAAGGAFNYLEPEIEDESSFPVIRSAFDLLARLHEGRNILGPAGTVRELLSKTNFLEFSLLRPHGEQCVLNLNKILQKARRFETGKLSYWQFARWISEQEADTSVEAESPLVEEDEDAVRLLTVHKAKGLQFPVVILANLVQKRSYRSSLVLGGGKYISLKIGKGLMNSRFKELEEGEKAREEAENARLLYVAATRAGDLLIIPRSYSRNPSYFDLIADGVADRSQYIEELALSDIPEIEWRHEPFRRKPRIGGAKDLEQWLAERGELVGRAARGSLVITPSGAVDHEAFAAAGGGESEKGTVSFGLAFHELMELVDIGSGEAPAALCKTVAEKNHLGEGEELRLLAERALGSDLLKAVRTSGRFYREVPFTLNLEDGYLEGRMDLIYEEAGSWRIVDYKTDNVQPEQLDRRLGIYRPQGLLYALAASKLGLEPVTEVVFYFVRSGEWRAIDVTKTLLDAFEAELKNKLKRSRAVP